MRSMRSGSKLVVCALVLMMPALCEDVDYLGVIEPNGTIVGINYSEYTPAFEEFLATEPKERDLSGYPEYLGRYLNETPEPIEMNYSLYAPVFREFIFTGPLARNLTGYPEYLGRYLNETPEKIVINYSLYTPAFEEFMIDENDSEANESEKLGLESYPSWMRKYLEN